MIQCLQINKLFGYKDIRVEFNNDITFLVGRNGCGKTTILNIVSSIISGNFDFLAKYKLESVKLVYLKKKKEKTLSLEKIDFDKFSLEWDNQQMDIDVDYLRTDIKRRAYGRESSIFYDEEINFYNDYIFDAIKKEFNNVYLPLSRDSNIDDIFKVDEFTSEKGSYISDTIYGSSRNSATKNIDTSLKYVNSLVKEKQRQIMTRFEALNKKMQKQMFESSFLFVPSPLISSESNKKISSLFDSKEEIERAFEELDMFSDKLKNEIDEFFSKLKGVHEIYTKWIEQSKDNDLSQENMKDVLSYIANSSQLIRTFAWKEIVMKTNINKSRIKQPMDTFFEMVNKYLNDSGKTLFFDDKEGILKFKTSHGEKGLSLENLSSGEKQIVIFFAYLMLKVDRKEGIFIVDEPELSLHIRWQERFSKDIVEVAPKLQIIFATHSPDIVGSYRDKVKIVGGDHA